MLTVQDPSAWRRTPLLVLAASLVGISFAAPLIRLSSSAAIVIATWRLGLSMVVVAAALLLTGSWREWRLLARRDVLMAMGSGVLLALHFWSWNTSLRYTTVAASVALVNMQPVLIAAASAMWLKEAPSRRQWAGVVIAVIGALIVGLADVPGGAVSLWSAITEPSSSPTIGSRALLGNGLALLGALTAAAYYLIGRQLRQRISVWPYVAIAYSAALATCILIALATHEVLTAVPPREMAIFVGLAIGPMLFGHTGMNWALGHLPAFVVNLTTLGEPIGATMLAAVLPGIAEVPGAWTIVGGAVVMWGILLAARKASTGQR